MLKSVLYPESPGYWQVGTRSCAFSIDSARAKRRKLQVEDIEAHTDSPEESCPEEDDPRQLDLTSLFRFNPASPWMEYLDRFAGCRIQKSKVQLGYPQAARLLEIVAAFACPEHFVLLKEAVAHYRLLNPENVVQAPLNMESHLYTVGLWTERLGLINVIIQRFVRSHFTSLIEDGIDHSNDQARHRVPRNAVTKSLMAMVVKIYPDMKGWDSSTNPAKKSAFLRVHRNLRRWRHESAIWSLIQQRFSSLALLALVPHHIQLRPNSRTISGSS